MLGGTIAAIYYWVITYWITAIVLAMYFAFYKKDGIKRNSFAYWVFFIFSPSFGYGLMMRNYDFYPKKTRIQSAAYYVFKYMGLVHFIHIAIWVLSTVFLIVIGRGEIVEGLFFVSILTFTLLLFYALLPGVIARLFFYTDFGPLSLENTELLDNSSDTMSPYRPVDMKEWERASIPEDSDNLRYDINDEYIALDDDDEEIVIDL